MVIDLPAPATEALFAETGIAFLFAALYHPSFRHAGPVRSQLGVPTAFNYLGPLTNPARPSSLAVGVADPLMGPVLAGVYAARGNTALVFHGGGLDELSTTGPSTVWIAADGAVSETSLDPVALGLPRGRAFRPAGRGLGAQRGGGPFPASGRYRAGQGHRAAQRRGGDRGRRGPCRGNRRAVRRPGRYR